MWSSLEEAWNEFQGYIGSLEGVNSITQIAQGAGVFRVNDLLTGDTGDPRDSTDPYTGTFMVYPPITLPNGDEADIGGMNAGVIQWYGNSATGQLVSGAGAVISDADGIAIEVPSSGSPVSSNSIKFVDTGGDTIARISPYQSTVNILEIAVDESPPGAVTGASIIIDADRASGDNASVRIRTSETDVALSEILLLNSSVITNEDGNDVDVRIESNGDANNFFSDGGNDRIGIGTASPSVKLDVNGSVNVASGNTYKINGTTITYLDVIGAFGNNGTIPASTTHFMQYGLTGTAASAANFAWPVAGTLKNLTFRQSGTQPASGSLVVTLQVNGVDTAITVTVPAGSSTANFVDSSNTVAISAGDTIRWKLVNNATGASTTIASISMQLQQSIT